MKRQRDVGFYSFISLVSLTVLSIVLPKNRPSKNNVECTSINLVIHSGFGGVRASTAIRLISTD
jgi:hypothetical protein